MKNQIISLGEDNRKVIGFNDDEILISSKNHKTFESLLASKEKSGMLESIEIIKINSIQKIDYNESDSLFKIHYKNEKGKTKKDSILLAEESWRDTFITEISQIRGLSKKEEKESTTKPLLLNILGVIMAIGGTFVFRGMAIDAQNGEQYEAVGRKRGLKNLLADAVETIGPTGVLLIGIALTAFLIYKTYSRFKNPATVVTYE